MVKQPKTQAITHIYNWHTRELLCGLKLKSGMSIISVTDTYLQQHLRLNKPMSGVCPTCWAKLQESQS